MTRRWTPGRDRRAERHAGPAGAVSDGRQHHVAVLGGGIAGLAAATALAERGVAVTLLEREDRLGGRVRAWPTDQGGTRTMSRGFHAFFRQYYNLRSLLRRADPELRRLVALADYPLVARGGHRDSFARIPRTPPWSIMGFVARSPTFALGDLRRVDVRAAFELLDVDFPATYSRYDGQSAASFLDRLHFPEQARHLALEVFARSFFADPDDFAAGEVVAMFHAYFLGSAEGLLFDVPDDDYDTALWSPLHGYLLDLGVDVRTGVTVDALSSGPGEQLGIRAGAEELVADAVVLAADPASTRRLALAACGPLGDDPSWRASMAATRTAPPFAVWRVWFDSPADPQRPAFLGTAGYGRVDNVSLLERFEHGAAEWARTTGGSVVELHAYALTDGVDEAGLRDEMRHVLVELYPEYAHATVLAEQFLVNDDCPLIGTGGWTARPGVRTPDPRVVLAGDGIRCPLPTALMERAATTGFTAANELLARWKLAGHELWTVPTSIRNRPTRALVRLAQRTSPVRTR